MPLHPSPTKPTVAGRPRAQYRRAAHANVMPAQQLAKERVVTTNDGGRGLTVEVAKQGQALGRGTFGFPERGYCAIGVVQCANDNPSRNDGLAVHGMRVDVVSENRWEKAN